MQPQASKDDPIFVIGAPRCGTTLTAKILGRHSRIFMPGESHFFEDIYARRQVLGSLDSVTTKTEILDRLSTLYGRYNQNNDQARIDELFADAKIRQRLEASFMDYRSILNTFMAVQMQSTNKARWGNNTPKDLYHVSEIQSFYPNAKFIVCVRDARDFLLSYKGRWKVTTAGHRHRLRELYHPVITSLLWKSSMRQVFTLSSKIPADNMMISRYEELVNDPEDGVRRMCAFIGESFESDMMNVRTHNSSAQGRSAGIFTTSVGRWRRKLSSEEAFIVQWLTKGELTRLGYQPETLSVNPVKLAAILASSPYAFYKALAANKDKRGPLVPYLAKRAAALLQRNN